MYHQIKKEAMVETLHLINEFSEKFPMMAINQINFYELAKFYQKPPKDFIAMVVFLDCMKHLNSQSEKKRDYYIDIHAIKQIQIRRHKEQWTFDVYKSTREKIKIKHVYRHQF